MNINCFSDNITNCHTRIKTCVWILEYDLHFLTVWKHI